MFVTYLSVCIIHTINITSLYILQSISLTNGLTHFYSNLSTDLRLQNQEMISYSLVYLYCTYWHVWRTLFIWILRINFPKHFYVNIMIIIGSLTREKEFYIFRNEMLIEWLWVWKINKVNLKKYSSITYRWSSRGKYL